MADGGFDVATGRTIRWFAHDTDSSLVVALSSGRLDIALIGVGVAASAFARGLDLRIFSVVCSDTESEGLLVSSKIKAGDVRSLAGKVIAVPFGSTPHFRLLETLRRAGGTLSAFRVVNLQTQQIAQAWSHGEIDAVAVSQPLLSQLQPQGTLVPLARTSEHSGMLLFVATGEFLQNHTVFLSRFVDIVVRSEDPRKEGGSPEQRDEAKSLSMMNGLETGMLAAMIGQYRPPPLAEQASPAWLGGGASAGLIAQLKATLEVWRWAGRLNVVDPELASAIAIEPVQMALGYRK